MAYKVFISAMRKDRDLAQDLAYRLKEAGVKVFLAEQAAVVGEPIKTEINRGLRQADEVIFILTEGSVNSPAVIFEMGAASGLHKRVTPVVVGVEPEELPPMVKQMPYVRYADLHNYIADLEKRAKAPEPQAA
jgi:hypothetical protein